jgi:class 3 adenylate cyclase/dihydrofolate reductase
VTLDGVMEAPGDDPHRDGRNRWALQAATPDIQRFSYEQLSSAEAILFGRLTFQIWEAFWPSAPPDEGFADQVNRIPKYVVSTSLRKSDWYNTSFINANVVDEVTKLKQQLDGDILIYGSADLVNSLMPHDLIDEYRLMFFPIVLGSGKHLFREESDISHLQLVETRTFSSGVVLLTYHPSAEAPTSEYTERFAWTQEMIESFQAAQNSERVLATVLFTDIVGSTGRAADMGDKRWRQLIDRHDRTARSEVERFRGRFIKSTGDGILATFDAPTRALRCAFGLSETLAKTGLGIRSAIHTGEIEVRDDDVGGIGVHIAARALEEAGERQVVVTRTVRDLATGTDLAFTPLGSVGLRGVPGEWDLFEATIS